MLFLLLCVSRAQKSEASYDVGLRRRLLPLFRSLNSWKVMNKQVYTCCLKLILSQTIIIVLQERCALFRTIAHYVKVVIAWTGLNFGNIFVLERETDVQIADRVVEHLAVLLPHLHGPNFVLNSIQTLQILSSAKS